MKLFIFILLLYFISYQAIAQTGEEHLADSNAEKCNYSLELAIENNSVEYNKLDTGYTHGNIIALHEKCPSGEDTSFEINSKMFIYPFEWGQEIPTPFLEENRAMMKKSDWRDFSQYFYSVRGLLVGILTGKNRFLAGKQVEWYHQLFQSDSIPLYNWYSHDREEHFIGMPLAIGKAFSLDGKQKKICVANQCTDYIKTEAGVELVSLDKASYLYLHSEINKKISVEDIFNNPLNVYLNATVKTLPTETDLYGEGSAGMRLFFDFGNVDLAVKKRYVQKRENRYNPLDYRHDTLMTFKLIFPFSIK